MTEELPFDDALDAMPRQLPLLPLRDVVLMPGAVVPLLVGRERSIRSLELAAEADKLLVVAAQRSPEIAEPRPRDLYDVGTIARVHQMMRLPDGTTKILIEGLFRVQLQAFVQAEDHLEAKLTAFETDTGGEVDLENDPELAALHRQVAEVFEEYALLHPRLPDEVAHTVHQSEDPVRRADAATAYLAVKATERQTVLAEADLGKRLRRVLQLLRREVEILRVEERLDVEVKGQIESARKEAYLNERMRAIRKELGYDEEDDDEVEEYVRKVEDADMSEEAREVAHKEISRLAKMAPMSPESTVIRH